MLATKSICILSAAPRRRPWRIAPSSRSLARSIFLSGLHHETYRERAKGEKRLTYLAQAAEQLGRPAGRVAGNQECQKI